jgi:hypothetical protein
VGGNCRLQGLSRDTARPFRSSGPRQDATFLSVLESRSIGLPHPATHAPNSAEPSTRQRAGETSFERRARRCERALRSSSED